ncbi:hypothetical protein MMC07_004543 [Pseudocyphellaria aurata]|nr:hypothetical protein [Pseudocyphellaria aurata]
MRQHSMDPKESAKTMIESEDPLFEGIPDVLFEEITMVDELEKEPLFDDIPDEFFDEVPEPSGTIADDSDLFEGIPDAFFDGIATRRGPSFLSLPPEIRNMIYDLVFVSPDYIGTHGMTNSLFFNDVVKWRNLDFAMSCRQIYAESANVFYAKNGFEFYYIRPFKAFMEQIGVERRRLITKLNYNFVKGSPFIVLRYLRSCTNLQQLNISLRVLKTGCQDQGWLYPVRNVKNFIFTDYPKLEFGDARGFGEAHESEARGECKVPPRQRDALFGALLRVKDENIHAQNFGYPSIFAPRKSAQRVTEEHREFSQRYKRKDEWQEWNELGGFEQDIPAVSLPLLMRAFFDNWGG